MNQPQKHHVESLAAAWEVDTIDLSERVRTCIGANPSSTDLNAELLSEIRSLRQEMREFRMRSDLLLEEIDELRRELNARRVTRLAPYSPSDNRMRLS